MFAEFWKPEDVRLNRAGQRRVWGMMVEFLPREVVFETFMQWAATQVFPPRPGQIRQMLNTHMRDFVDKNPHRLESQRWTDLTTRKPPVERPCGTCKRRLRFDGDTGERYECDGGRVYRFAHGQWFAARCPDCYGNLHDKRLGLPRPGKEFRTLWTDLESTPGQALFEALGYRYDRLITKEPCDFLKWDAATAMATLAWIARTPIDPQAATMAAIGILDG